MVQDKKVNFGASAKMCLLGGGATTILAKIYLKLRGSLIQNITLHGIARTVNSAKQNSKLYKINVINVVNIIAMLYIFLAGP